jgi:arylsulfatase A-like enzyme
MSCRDAHAPEAPIQPNIIVVLTDDLDSASLDPLTSVASLARNGLTFDRFYITTPTCGPSRASFFRGQYAHNHRIFTNRSPRGGFLRFRDTGLELSTVGTWLQDAGYRTMFLGKYMNEYPSGEPNYIPPGWNQWFATLERYQDYRVNDNGEVVAYGSTPEEYETDVLLARSVDWVREANADGVPFFLFISSRAPHWPAVPAPRHAGAYAGSEIPLSPSFNEQDVADKPEHIRSLPLLSDADVAELRQLFVSRSETMMAVDEMFAELMNVLAEEGITERTYVLFTSDNGFHQGQHRLPAGKSTAYEEDIRVPLYVWGPGVASGTSRRLVANIDIAPTIAELAGARVPPHVDGLSFVPLLTTPDRPWRSEILIERFRGRVDEVNPLGNAFSALRTESLLYVEWHTGERELYDTRSDPYEIESLHASAAPELMNRLSERLGELMTCAGRNCR